jgi:hypothetical protein
MGVDFFQCDGCGETICDCGSYERCEGECGRRWCERKCADMDGADEDYVCKYCREEDVEDGVLLKFLLKHYKLTEKKAKKMYFKANPPERFMPPQPDED